jgi:predicted RNA methylase
VITYLAVCARLEGNQLVAAECEALTGGLPDENGIARGVDVSKIPQAAYIHSGLRLIAEAETLDELVRSVAQQEFAADGFRIEHLRLSRVRAFSWRHAVLALAAAIPYRPNLDEPQHRFLLITRAQRVQFAEYLIETEHSYQKHDAKPHHLSISLPARLSRALVNLLPGSARSILDPCCGTGSILLEAQSLGLAVQGGDVNPHMAGMARKNLAHFGYSGTVLLEDARQCTATADAVITDLPYGRYNAMDEDSVRAIVANCARLAPMGIYVAGTDITDWLVEAGYVAVDVYRVQKWERFTRFVHHARR